MKRINYFILVIFLLAGCSPVNTVSNVIVADAALTNDIKVLNVKTNDVQKNYHRLLIFGAGSHAVRLFLDNLSQALNSGFSKKNIQLKYYFLGNDRKEETRNYKAIISIESFDAILVFTQTDISEVTEKSEPYPFGLSSTKLDQTFSMNIYETADFGNSVWDATLKVNCNFTKSKVYSTISSQIFKELKANKICD